MDFKVEINAIANIDKLSLSASHDIGEIKPLNLLAGYWHTKTLPIHKIKDADKGTYVICQKYKFLSIYVHLTTLNRATLCHKRLHYRPFIPSYRANFESSFSNPLKYKNAFSSAQQLKDHYGVDLRIAELHLAFDYICPTVIGLTCLIKKSIKPGRKRTFRDFNGTRVYGSPRSSNTIAIYDKRKQLLDKKGIKVMQDICRVETRLKVPRLNNFVSNVEEVGAQNWSWVYGRFFSFHQPNSRLINQIGEIAFSKNIRELRDYMYEKYDITPSNFYRDYLDEHPVFTKITKEVLSGYQWNLK